MIFRKLVRSATVSLVFAFGSSLPALGAALSYGIDSVPSPVAAASEGLGIVSLVHETTALAAAPFGHTLGFPIETREIVRTSLTEFELKTALGLQASETDASFEPGAGKLAARLANFGTSSVYIPPAERGFTWRVLPAECVLFLEVTLGIMALGFLPLTMRRVC